MIRRALEFIRLVDPHDGNISLTNVILAAVTVRLLLIPNPSFADVSMLLVTMGGYSAKKVIGLHAEKKDEP